MAWCEAQGVEYVLGIAQNPRLKRSLAPELEQARQACERTGQAARVFKDFPLPDTGQLEPRAACDRQGGALAAGGQPAFRGDVPGARADGGAGAVRGGYCARGDMENRIKEQQLALFADRTSAQTLRANQLRLYFASFAYTLLELLRRWGLAGTQLARAQCDTIRLSCSRSACGSGSACGPCGCRSTRASRKRASSGRCWPASRACPCAVSSCTPAIVSSPVGGRRGSVRLQGGLQAKTSPNNRGSGDPYQASARIRRPTQHCQVIHPPQMDKTPRI